MDPHEDLRSDVAEVERGSAGSLARSAQLINRIDELLAEQRNRLEAVDRSLEKAREVSRAIDIDLHDHRVHPQPDRRDTAETTS